MAYRLGFDDHAFPCPDNESGPETVAVLPLLSALFFSSLEVLGVNLTYPAIALNLLGQLGPLGVAKPLDRLRDLALQTMGDNHRFELSD